MTEAVSVSLVLWICYHVVALPMAVWSAVSAAIGGPGVGGRQRTWTMLAGGLLPVSLAAAALAVPLGRPEFALGGLVVPVLTFAAIWGNFLVLRGATFLTHLLHVPVVLWNAGLCSIYALRALQELAGLDFGTVGTGLVGGHAMVQGVVGHEEALALPVWLHLPICMPVGRTHGWMHRLAFGACGITSGCLVVMLALAMPVAHSRSAAFRAPVMVPPPLTPAKQLGITMSWDHPTDDDLRRDGRREAWRAIGASTLVFDVDRALLDDPERLRAARDQLAHARGSGVGVVAIARPPAALLRRPALDVPALAQEMAHVHWLTAERLTPDVLFLFSGPFDDLMRYRVEPGTVEQWYAVIARAADEMRQANPRVVPAVAFQSRALHARGLFDRLRAGDSPVAAVGLVALPEQLPSDRALLTFEVLERWLDEGGGQRPVWLLDVGACPTTSGGQVGQWNYLARALALASRRDDIAGVAMRALDDGEGAQRGLRDVFGSPRQAFRELEARVQQAAAPPK